MPRQKPVYTAEFPYHITARCHNREWFNLPMSQVWETMSNYLYFIHHAYKVEIYAFVLMSNHFHLLIRFPENNMSEAMTYFMRESSRMISRQAGRINQTYGTRNYRTVITKNIHFENVYKYLYRNPVEAKICQRVEEYPFSTLQIRLGKQRGIIPLGEDSLLAMELDKTLKWLNTSPAEQDWKEVKKALRHATFALPMRNGGEFVHRLELNRI